jgi:hypothetical protein
MIMNNG